MRIRYEINENNEIFAWNEDSEQVEPFLYQPNHPDGSAWSNRADAQDWVDKWILHMTDPDNNEFPAYRDA